jgi:hypothetical protein
MRILILSIFGLLFLSNCTNPSNSIENTRECLTKNTGNFRHTDGRSFWKFSPNGTFKYRTTYFNGMGASGTYIIKAPGEIYINYIRYPSDVQVRNQTVRLTSCSELVVGESNIFRAINDEYF